MVTLNDIALKAGVSVSTVSRVINNSEEISEETTNYIMQIAEELGYKAKKRNKAQSTIGVIVPELSSLYYAELVHTLENSMRSKGYNMLVSLSDFDTKKDIQNIKNMISHEVRGIICSLSDIPSEQTGKEILSVCEESNVPIVFLSDWGCQGIICYDHINLNQKTGMQLVVNHLMELGHTKIGFIGDDCCLPRLEDFKEFMEKSGLKIDSRFVKMGKTRFEKGGYEQMNMLLSNSDHPTAVIAAYDQFAIGALKAISEAGLLVPKDISIVGFDNIPTDEFLPQKLTSVTNPVASMGQIAIRLLFGKIEKTDDGVIQSISLQPSLIIRETTGKIV